MNKNIRYKISLVLNIIIVILTIAATIIMMTGFKFMHGPEPILETTKIGAFKFFTVDSNLFAGIISIIFIYLNISIIKGKEKEISNKMYILKLMATTAVSLTFLVVFIYLGNIAENGIKSLLQNSNLFLHLIIPVLNIVDFILLKKDNNISYKHAFYGLIPTVIYAIFYTTNVVIHIENGKVSPKYDWYWFVQNGVWTMVIVGPIILLFTYIISVILVLLNIIINKKLQEKWYEENYKKHL